MRSTATASRRSIACAARARKLSPRLIQHQFSYYTEINLLTALGRTKEARAMLEARGGVPTGEVLKLSYWIAQMHLGVAENRRGSTSTTASSTSACARACR